MTNDRPEITTSDPARIRALAHPLRLRLLDLLDDDGPATATECARATGESVASCSFHLHQLAKYGFVEPAERRGREKPWRSVSSGRSTRYDPDVPGSLRAAGEMARVVIDREAQRLHAWIDAAPRDDDAWLLASVMTTQSFWATRDELAALSAEVQALTERFAGRSQDPSLRPDGARSAHLFATVHADPDDARTTR